MILLEPFSREIQVNQAREGRMDGQDSQESLGFLGKRWCIESLLMTQM